MRWSFRAAWVGSMVWVCAERELGLGLCSSSGEFYFGFIGPVLFWYFSGSFRGEPGPSSILVL